MSMTQEQMQQKIEELKKQHDAVIAAAAEQRKIIADYIEPSKSKFVNGTDHAAIGASVGNLVNEKQHAYGDSFGKAGRVMRELYPNGIAVDQLDDALTIVRIVDKLFRIATRKNAFGESPYRDIAGYSLLAVGRDERSGRAALQERGLTA
jgi:hypothetical protein